MQSRMHVWEEVSLSHSLSRSLRAAAVFAALPSWLQQRQQQRHSVNPSDHAEPRSSQASPCTWPFPFPAPQWRNWAARFEVQLADTVWGPGWLPWAAAAAPCSEHRPRHSYNSCCNLREQRRRRATWVVYYFILFFIFLFSFLSSQTGRRLPVQAAQMDHNAPNSEKSQLIHERNAKTYSLKLQRWVYACLTLRDGAHRHFT